MMRVPSRDQCCLCGKTKVQVRKLIVGLHGAVCSDCIDLCNDILNERSERGFLATSEGWDGTLTVPERDRDVFDSPEAVKRALSNWAELVRTHVLRSSAAEDKPD